MTIPRATVFIVEDDLDVSDSVKAVATALGHTCHTFDCAEAVLAHWGVRECDCIIIDVDLPEMDGIELLSTLRKAGSCVPAVFYTGRSDARLRRAAEELGPVPVVRKGNDTRNIVECLARIVGGTSG